MCTSKLGPPKWLSGLKKTNPPATAGNAREMNWIPGGEDPLEEEMATHSSILAWRTLWTEEPGRLQYFALQRLGPD